MLNVAIFDQFYLSDEHPPEVDTVAHALAPLEHEVVTDADHLGTAVLDIVAMSQGEAVEPDVIIMAGRLKGELEYVRNPATITHEEAVEVRTFGIGKRRIENKLITTTLLPVPLTEDVLGGPMALPRSYRSPVNKKRVSEHAAWVESFFMGSGRTPYVLAHLSRLLLPKEIRIIGISSYNTMESLPINAVIARRGKGDIEELHEAITQPRY